MPDEDKNSGGALVLDFRKRWRHVKTIYCLERFSFQSRKVIGFAFTTLRDWLKKLAPLFRPIRSKTNTNRDSLVRVFPRFASATCIYFVFWLVHLITCVLCDWLEWLLWFWFLRHSIENRSKTPRKQLLGEYLFWTVFLCAVQLICIIKMLKHSLLWLIGIYLYSFTNNAL